MMGGLHVKKGGKLLYVRLILVSLIFSGSIVFSEEESKPADVFAGKTVNSFESAGKMIYQRMKNAPRLGENAPNFLLLDAVSGKKVSLSDLCKKKPVVLWFGSSTCGETCRSIRPLIELSQRYRDKVQFVLVYIREAHPLDGLAFGPTANIYDPKSFAERKQVASGWKKREKIPFPVLVDSMGDSMAIRWAGWPVRLFVIDQKQKVIYAGQQGPWFYNPGKWYHHEGGTNLVGEDDWEGISKESLEDFLQEYSPAK